MLEFLALLIIPELIKILGVVISISLIGITLAGAFVICAKLVNKLANEITKSSNG